MTTLERNVKVAQARAPAIRGPTQGDEVMKKIWVYFDYAKKQPDSGAENSEPILAEKIKDIKWRIERFESELALNIPNGGTVTVLSKEIGDRVAAFNISSSLEIPDLKNNVEKTAEQLSLAPPDYHQIGPS